MMKFKSLNESKITLHPGKFQDINTFLDDDGNPYDLIPCNPMELAKGKSKSSQDDDGDDEYFDIDNYDDFDNDDEYDDFYEDEIDYEDESNSEDGEESETESDERDNEGDSEDTVSDYEDDDDSDSMIDSDGIKPSTSTSNTVEPKIIHGKLINPNLFIDVDGKEYK